MLKVTIYSAYIICINIYTRNNAAAIFIKQKLQEISKTIQNQTNKPFSVQGQPNEKKRRMDID